MSATKDRPEFDEATGTATTEGGGARDAAERPPVAASDPRALVVDRAGQQSASPEADRDRAAAAEQAGQ